LRRLLCMMNLIRRRGHGSPFAWSASRVRRTANGWIVCIWGWAVILARQFPVPPTNKRKDAAVFARLARRIGARCVDKRTRQCLSSQRSPASPVGCGICKEAQWLPTQSSSPTTLACLAP
jgi:hypothetical protein